MVKTNFLLDIGYFPTGLAETNEFVPSQNISPTFLGNNTSTAWFQL